MNDTVKLLMNLADNYADAQEGFGKSELTLAQRDNTRRILEAEISRLFTTLPSEQITAYIRGMDIDLREDLCAFDFRSGVRWAEKQHGIGERNEIT